MDALLNILYHKYQKSAITKKELAKELGISVATINRRIEENSLAELPKFRRAGRGEKSQYLFPLQGVVEYLEAAK